MEQKTKTPAFLNPVPAEKFFAEHWEQSFLAIRRDQPDFFRDVADMRELDRLVSSTRIPATNFNLARGNAPLPFPEYCVDSSFVDKNRALSLHEQGATIILRSIEQWSPSLNRVRIEAEEFFGFEAQINIYLTPPSEKSTPPHWDTHDLFILQIEGSKRWHLFEGNRTLPLSDERFIPEEDFVGDKFEEVVLHPGDTLYLPRGVIHEPVADTYSVHVALGIHTVCWYDLLSTAFELWARKNGSPLREALPRWCRLGGGTPDFDFATELTGPGVIERAAEILRTKFEARRAVDNNGRLLDIRRGPELDGSLRYSRRAGFTIEASESPESIQIGIATNGQRISVPRDLKDAVEYIIAHESFTADELPAKNSADEGLALCVALHEIGALKRVAS